MVEILEARVGIEPTHKGFADLSLTTWVPRLNPPSIAKFFGPCQRRAVTASADAYPHFNAIRDGRSDHGIVATLLGRCDRVILELSLVGFLSPLARKFDTYP